MTITKVENQIYRGPQPQTDSDWLQLRAMGISKVLDLETCGVGIFGENIDAARAIAKSYGIEMFSKPMGEIAPPSLVDRTFCVSYISSYRDLGIYVHCKSGVDRTGMVCATYRMMVDKWSKAQAVDEMKKMGMHFWYYWWAWSL
jgi:tyrosine-protein phosphatase SIW14